MSRRLTRVPRCGSTSTKPSSASRPSASETGNRETPSRLQIASLLDELAGREGQRDDRLADDVLDALRGAAAALARQRWKERIGECFPPFRHFGQANVVSSQLD